MCSYKVLINVPGAREGIVDSAVEFTHSLPATSSKADDMVALWRRPHEQPAPLSLLHSLPLSFSRLTRSIIILALSLFGVLYVGVSIHPVASQESGAAIYIYIRLNDRRISNSWGFTSSLSSFTEHAHDRRAFEQEVRPLCNRPRRRCCWWTRKRACVPATYIQPTAALGRLLASASHSTFDGAVASCSPH